MEYIIPRDLKVKEVIAYGLTGKQMLYVALGLGGSLGVWSLGVPVDMKLAGTVFVVGGSLLFSMGKIKGQEADKFVVNTMKYPFRQKEFGGDENVQKTPVVRIRYNLQ